MDEYAWIFGAGGCALAFLTFYGGWAVARYRGEHAGEVAMKAQAKADQLAAEFAAYKTEVIGKFATIEMLRQSEDRIADALNRLADRLDRILEAPRQTAPRTRSTKA